MRALLVVALTLTLLSCSTAYHCKKCVTNGTTIIDNVVVYDTLWIPAAEADSTFKKLDYTINWDSLRNANPDEFPESPPCPELPAVMEIKKGKASAIIKQTNEGLDVKVKCDPDTVIKKIEIPCITDVHTGYTLFQMILACLATAGALCIVYVLKRR